MSQSFSGIRYWFKVFMTTNMFSEKSEFKFRDITFHSCVTEADDIIVTLSDMMAVGCDLNGVHYENGESFQPSPLYKCICIAGAIGCSPAFLQKPARLLGPAPLISNIPAGLRSNQPSRKHQQDTTYMSGVCLSSKSWTNCQYFKAYVSNTMM